MEAAGEIKGKNLTESKPSSAVAMQSFFDRVFAENSQF
jgi:hypothetical protein